MRVSLVITTYDNPRSLELVLAGVARQSRPVDEVLVADDGSGSATRDVVDAFGRGQPFPVQHVWHEHRGFRKCTILNRAVEAATGEYVIFLDGDCIPLRTFVAAHVGASRRGAFLAGSKVWLRDGDSRALTPEAIRGGLLDRFGGWQWKARRGRRLLLTRIRPLARALDLLGRAQWRGENASTLKEHIVRVNGFDERFSYGWEDADFGQRLLNAGIGSRSIRYRCPVLHIDHPRPYRVPESLHRNRQLYEANRALRLAATPYGLVTTTTGAVPEAVPDASRSPSR